MNKEELSPNSRVCSPQAIGAGHLPLLSGPSLTISCWLPPGGEQMMQLICCLQRTVWAPSLLRRHRLRESSFTDGVRGDRLYVHMTGYTA